MSRWKPKVGDAYYFFDSDFNVTITHYDGYTWDEDRIAMGNCFNTKDDACAAAEKIKALLLSLQDNDENLQDNIQDMVTNTCQAMDKGKENVAKATCNFGKLPKLTAEVFDRPDCPVDAKIAVVNEDGSAYWGSFNTARPNFRGGWDGENGSWFSIPGKFDSSDWQNSLIKRPSKAAFDKLLKNYAEKQADAIWQKAREHRLSEQYHNGPEKTTLPDWCKVGEWVYLSNKEYDKIESIDDFGINLASGTIINKKYIHEEAVSARLRPWNFEEAPYQLKVKRNDWSRGAGEELTFLGPRSGKWGYLVGAYDNECFTFYSFEEMKILYRTLDGEPCGVLEHLENGTWVE
jgi:hypothetical protein